MPKENYKQTKEHKEKISKALKGKKKSASHIKAMSKAQLGKKYPERSIKRKLSGNPNWKGGTIKDMWGYIQIKMPEHPFANIRGYVKEHRFVYEQFLRRYLTSDEVIHHIDFDKTNNHIDNLYLTTRKHNTLMNFELHRLMKELLKRKILYFEEETGFYYFTGKDQND